MNRWALNSVDRGRAARLFGTTKIAAFDLNSITQSRGPVMRRVAIAVVVLLGVADFAAGQFEAGAARIDITPPTGYPMWGYSSRKDKPCEGVRDPLHARALVLKAGEAKIALVSLDLGRAPTRDSMTRIREALKPDAYAELFVVGSHTHHGPVIEL